MANTPTDRRVEAAQELLRRDDAQSTLLDFINFCWWKPWPFAKGNHTRAICRRIDDAIERYDRGISSFLLIQVCYGHGKSDILSRALPPYFLGAQSAAGKDPDVIMSGYGATLIFDFSSDAQNIMRGDKYQTLFPQAKISSRRSSPSEWQLENKTGRVVATGLGGALMGKRGHLIVCDDYCKSRAEARSAAYRKKTWGAFQDLLSRRAPVCIVIVLATPWHTDDVAGRIQEAKKAEPDFPAFDVLRFPAKNAGPDGTWDGTYLFPERFCDDWYRNAYAIEGKFAAGLLDCCPVIEGGNRFAVSQIQIHADKAEFPSVCEIRAWDLASTKKERDKDDPDSTVGVRGGNRMHRGVPEIWISDVVHGQWEAPERDRVIIQTAHRDGAAVAVHVEAFGAYKDAYITLREVLRGVCIVRKSQLPGDKSAKLAGCEPIIEAGNLHLLRAPWNEPFIRQFQEFPDGSHDDFCDPVAIIQHDARRLKSMVMQIP